MLAPQLIPVQTARGVIAERPAAGWNSLDDFYAHPGLAGLILPLDVQLQPQLRTRWFALDLIVELQGAELVETALIDARATPAKVAVRRWGSED